MVCVIWSEIITTVVHLGNTIIKIEGGSILTDSVNNSVHGTGIGKGGDYVENATANGFMPGIIKMTGGTISYPDAMKEFSSITHDP